MKTVGIIAEYNPFHLGHRYHLQEAKSKTGSDNVVVVMSGNTVQRGDFSIIDKFTRAKEAVINGADLVLEIPVCYSSQSAEIFAKGSIEILNALGIVDCLAFGSESDDISEIKKISDILSNENEEFQNILKEYLKEGISFPSARQKALEQYIDRDKSSKSELLSSSNDILGIEYLKNLNRLKSNIVPHTIKRVSSTYNDTDINKLFPSATAIRKMLISEQNPESITNSTTENMKLKLLENYRNNNIVSLDDYFDELKVVIIREQVQISKYFEVNEGIENLILKNIYKSSNLEDLIENIKSKRYTRTRIRRTLLNILLGIEKSDMYRIINSKSIPYTRILAFNDKGRKILKEIDYKSEERKIEIINKPSNFKPIDQIQQLKYKYDNIANLVYYSKMKIYNKNRIYSDLNMSPIYVKET